MLNPCVLTVLVPRVAFLRQLHNGTVCIIKYQVCSLNQLFTRTQWGCDSSCTKGEIPNAATQWDINTSYVASLHS